jgi:hypothetical protein
MNLLDKKINGIESHKYRRQWGLLQRVIGYEKKGLNDIQYQPLCDSNTTNIVDLSGHQQELPLHSCPSRFV